MRCVQARGLEQPPCVDLKHCRKQRCEERCEETRIDHAIAGAVTRGAAFVGRAHVRVARAARVGVDFGGAAHGVRMAVGGVMRVVVRVIVRVAVLVIVVMHVVVMPHAPATAPADAQDAPRAHADRDLREQDQGKHEAEQSRTHDLEDFGRWDAIAPIARRVKAITRVARE